MKKKKRKNNLPLLLPLAAVLLLAILALRPRSVSAPEHSLRETDGGALGYYIGGVLQTDYTGIVRDHAAGRWYYAENGLVDPGFTGFAANAQGWWYFENGELDFSRCALVEGAIEGKAGLWYVLGGMVKTDYSGAALLPEGAGRCVIRDGRLDGSFTGFLHDADGWWYTENGWVRSDAARLIEGSVDGKDGLWYVRSGLVQLDYRGLLTLSDELWCVNGGRVETEKTGIYMDGDEAWLCREGRVDTKARCAWTDDAGDWIVTEGRAQAVRSEEDRTLFRAMELLARIVDESMSREEKLRACFYAVRSCRESSPRYPHLYQIDWPVIYANDIFVNGTGNCFSFAAAFAYLAKALGYEEVYCCNSGGHGWAEIDGLMYDPEWDRSYEDAELFALSYDTPLGQIYKRALNISDKPGNEWMHVKL